MQKYVNKGDEIAVEGKLTYRTYEDKKAAKGISPKSEWTNWYY